MDSVTTNEAMQFHPIADVFPLIQGSEFDQLVEDIQQFGLREPIVLLNDMILDGRNRWRACLVAQVEPHFEAFPGGDPVAFVISANLRRRHMDESQRSLVAAKLANMRQGERTDLASFEAKLVSQADAANLLSVSRSSVQRAREVLDHAVPELTSQVERGEVSVSVAADVASLPEPEQHEIVARGKKEILEIAKRLRAEKMEQRRAERLEKLATIAQGNGPLPTDRKYPVLYVDPPWTFDVFSEAGQEKAPENHYPCMSLTDICALPIPELATDDAILFLWATVPHMFESAKVLEAWGFEYKSSFVWVKDKIGCGYYNRNQHEVLLVATRGNIPAPAPSDRVPSVVHADRGRHSEKPDRFYDIIEGYYPSLPRIELFAREARPGWAFWGNQAHQAPQNDGDDLAA
jgi:N6-adenosine-specific RNA methylase IME4